MSDDHDMTMLQSRLSRYHVNRNLVLNLSLGLVLLTLIPSALVYAETITVDVGGESFDIEYTVLGMTVTGITPDLPANSLILDVNLTDLAGFLDITFDREFFDTRGLDEPFLLLIDGDELRYTETEGTTEYRTLSIRIPDGSEELEIIGTKLGPDVVVPPPPPPVSTPPPPPPPVSTSPPVDDMPADEKESDVMSDVMPSDTEKPDAMSDIQENESGSMESEPTVPSKCGPGTIFVDGVCVLDERCGPGTTLEDGICVLASEPPPQQSASSKSVSNKGLIIGATAGFIIAGVVAVVLGLISKASRSN